MSAVLKIQDDILSFVRPITDERLLERIKMAVIRELEESSILDDDTDSDVPDAFYMHLERIMDGLKTGNIRTYSSGEVSEKFKKFRP